MPNWAISNVTIHSTDIKGLKHLNDIICAPENFVSIPEKWKNDWVGTILLCLGFNEKESYNIASRDFILDCELSNEKLELTVESAWGLHYTALKTICETALTNFSIIYTCEELGNEVFVSNDPDVVGTYYVEEDSQVEYYTKKEIEMTIPEWNKEYNKDWKSADDILNDEELPEDFWIFQFEYASFEELSE